VFGVQVVKCAATLATAFAATFALSVMVGNVTVEAGSTESASTVAGQVASFTAGTTLMQPVDSGPLTGEEEESNGSDVHRPSAGSFRHHDPARGGTHAIFDVDRAFLLSAGQV
jgi:hypothetical protein